LPLLLPFPSANPGNGNGRVGLNEDLIRRYVRYQEEQERRDERERRDDDLFQSPPS